MRASGPPVLPASAEPGTGEECDPRVHLPSAAEHAARKHKAKLRPAGTERIAKESRRRLPAMPSGYRFRFARPAIVARSSDPCRGSPWSERLRRSRPTKTYTWSQGETKNRETAACSPMLQPLE